MTWERSPLSLTPSEAWNVDGWLQEDDEVGEGEVQKMKGEVVEEGLLMHV